MTSSYARANWIFLRLLGCVYLTAFWSLAQQVPGLVGPHGILPAADYVADIRSYADAAGVGADRYRLLPTLFWLSTSDAFLHTVAAGGALLSLLVVFGMAPAAVLPILWMLYLSLSVVCGEFLSYQWDALLLETGLLACFAAPLRWRHRLRDAEDPPRVIRWLIWWLVFRLMFGSGLVKLASGDPTWRGLTALAVHYETQPLPTPVAWYVFQLPLWFHRASTLGVLAVELTAPWLIVGGRRMRTLAAVVLIGLQAIIALTGNYGFFNLLTVALCVMLLDDRALRAAPRQGHASSADPAHPPRRRWAPLAAAIILAPVSLATFASQVGVAIPAVTPLAAAIDPLRSVNRYGLFAVMTTVRLEIVIEGSADGSSWRAYEFFDKPGDVTRAPPWVAPFQPRLDWQMWFAALSSEGEERWFRVFCRRLLEGSPEVTALLAYDPFAGHPPPYVRATMYRYRFTDWGTGRATGAWWVRERVREYLPVMTLGDTRAGRP